MEAIIAKYIRYGGGDAAEQEPELHPDEAIIQVSVRFRGLVLQELRTLLLVINNIVIYLYKYQQMSNLLISYHSFSRVECIIWIE